MLINPLSLSAVFKQTALAVKTSWKKFLFSSLLIVLAACLTIGVFSFLYLLSLAAVPASQVVLFDFLWLVVNSLATFLLSIILQILVINNFNSPQLTLGQNIRSLAGHFYQMFLLNLALGIIFLLVGLPIYTALVLFLIPNTVLGLISLLLGIILAVLAACALVYSPLLVMAENLNWLSAVKKSWALCRKYFAATLLNVIALSIMLLLLNWLSVLAVRLPLAANIILSFITFAIMALLVFAYPFAMYKQVKSSDNS